MIWTRKELKERAKEALQRNYWKIVLVSFIAILIGGGVGSSGGRGHDSSDDVSQSVQEGIVDGYNQAADDDVSVKEAADIVLEKVLANFGDMGFAAMLVYGIVFIFILLVVAAVTIAVDILLWNPILVGTNRFMLKSVDDKAQIAEVGYTFDHNYKNGVKTMFFRDLYIGLWSLLFIIPGIYKAYQYRMVSFILAEHPDMPYKEVLQMSSDIMNGQKWNAFVLDLSFILWHILGGITCGIAEIFYVAPYVRLTNASLYRKLTNQDVDAAYCER